MSRLTGVHRQAFEVTEIERLELRFSNRLPVFLVSGQAGYGHGYDVGIEVHIVVFLFVLWFLVVDTQLTSLGTAILLSLSTGSDAFAARGSPFTVAGLVFATIRSDSVMSWPICRLTRPFKGHTNYAQQVIPMHGLAQKSHRAGAQRLVFLFLARVGAEEDHGNTRPNFFKTPL